MKHIVKKLISLLTTPTENKSAIEQLVDQIVPSLRSDKKFVRRLREVAFIAAQRRCEFSVWEALLRFAVERLNETAESKTCSSGQMPHSILTASDWTQQQLSEVMGGVDQGLVSNALAIVEARSIDNAAPLSLRSLIAILTSLEKHWSDLGQLPPFQELRDEWYMSAIGHAQHYVCTKYRLPCPNSLRPTADELNALKCHFLEDFDSDEPIDDAWTNWGLGWLVTREVLVVQETRSPT